MDDFISKVGTIKKEFRPYRRNWVWNVKYLRKVELLVKVKDLYERRKVKTLMRGCRDRKEKSKETLKRRKQVRNPIIKSRNNGIWGKSKTYKIQPLEKK